MNAIVERYDTDAADYARYWAPVLEPTARRLLDIIDPIVAAREGRPLTILDVGAGAGALAYAALARWPQARLIISDPAAGMLELARRRGPAGSTGATADRLDFVLGPADDLPLAEGSVDIAMSSFVLQLVPDRPAALREIGRVLRPGGLLAYVTWLDRDARQPFRPMEEFDEAVADLDVDEPETTDQPHAGDVRSPRAAADELRRAGFVRASVSDEMLAYDWTLESYLEYKLAYDERALVSVLSTAQRSALERFARDRLLRLAPADFRWHAPVVFARAQRP